MGASVEEGVAATDVSGEAVKLSYSVAEVDGVGFARLAAVFDAGARTHEGAEDAVLHVEEGHVLVEGEF